jgi:hypothetical protein
MGWSVSWSEHTRSNGSLSLPHESSCFGAGVNVEASCEHHGIASNHTNGISLHATWGERESREPRVVSCSSLRVNILRTKSNNYVACPVGHDLEEITVIQDCFNHRVHVVWLVWILRSGQQAHFEHTSTKCSDSPTALAYLRHQLPK